MSRVGWLDASSGASGDMLLGALVGAGVPLPVLQHAIDALGLRIGLRATEVRRGPLAATQVHVELPADAQPRRTLPDVRTVLDAAELPGDVGRAAFGVFERLATAEARVHGGTVEQVHFHEVGALDALADVVGVCAGLAALGLAELHCSPVALGGGTALGEHGALPVPVPAVLALLEQAGAPVHGGPVDMELCTPTGAALLCQHVTDWGPLPLMTVSAVGVGAGGRDLPGRANALRLVVGAALPADQALPSASTAGTGTALLLETNVDDLDPRLWPPVLARLLAAGVADAWLTPVLMKKGRPAHTLSVLLADEPALARAVQRLIFTETSAIGLREQRVGKRALDRELATVQVDGQPIRVKRARLAGEVVNASLEHDDIAAAAVALDRPVKTVLAQAGAAAVAAGLWT